VFGLSGGIQFHFQNPKKELKSTGLKAVHEMVV